MDKSRYFSDGLMRNIVPRQSSLRSAFTNAVRSACIFSVSSILIGCSSLPTAGPTADAVFDNASVDGNLRYEVIDITIPVTNTLAHRPPDSLTAAFEDYRPSPDVKLGVGDTVSVTVWEAALGGLFSAPLVTDRFSTGSKSATIPEQAIARDGAITIPYGGRVRAAGQTVEQVQKAIEKALEGKAIQPQVLVTVVRPISNSVTVTGEVINGARIPLSVKGDQLMDVIATAGGIRAPINETFVQLTRGQKTARVAMSRIVQDPRENIFMRPDDILTLVREPRVFMAYGATGRNAEIAFEAENVTLSQALAKAGGLLDTRADPQGVFVLRYEPDYVLRKLVPDSPLLAQRYSPVVYRLDLRDINNFFLAQRFQIYPKDVVYVSNAAMSDATKALQAIGMLTGPAGTAATIYNVSRR